MRDDLKKILKELNHLYQNKILLLDKILLSETEKKYALKSKNSEILIKNIERNDENIDEINSIDYEITAAKEKVCSIIGVQLDNLNEFMTNSEESLFLQLIEVQNKIKIIIQTLIKEREEIIDAIENESMSIKKDMDSLLRIYKLSAKKNETF